MKHILLTTGSAVAFMLGGCVLVVEDAEAYNEYPGPNSYAGTDIQMTLDEDGDYRVTGTDVELSGRVGGLLRVRSADFEAHALTVGALDVSAADVVFTGDIEGDAEVNSADFVLTGSLGGGLNINTADLEVDGAVYGPIQANMADGNFNGQFGAIRANAADISFSSNSEVSGELYLNAADLFFAGHASDGLDASVRYAEINGSIDGLTAIQADPGRRPHGRRDGVVVLGGEFDDVEICARQVIVSGSINGTLNVMADAEPEFRDGGSASNLNFIPRDGQRCERS